MMLIPAPWWVRLIHWWAKPRPFVPPRWYRRRFYRYYPALPLLFAFPLALAAPPPRKDVSFSTLPAPASKVAVSLDEELTRLAMGVSGLVLTAIIIHNNEEPASPWEPGDGRPPWAGIPGQGRPDPPGHEKRKR